MARDAQYFLSQTLADVARYAATLSASLETATEQIAALTAERDAVQAELTELQADLAAATKSFAPA